MENLEMNEKTINMKKISDMYFMTAAHDARQQYLCGTQVRSINNKVQMFKYLSEQCNDDLFSLKRFLYCHFQPLDFNEEKLNEVVWELNHIANFESYDSKKLAIIFDLFEKVNGRTGGFEGYHYVVKLKDFYTKFSPTMTDEEFLTLCSKLYEIMQEAKKTQIQYEKLEAAKKILDTLSVVWPEAKEQFVECIIQMENTPTYGQYFNQEMSKLPNMIEIKKNIKK